MDIAYDEIPERHYKESEVRGVRSLTSERIVCLVVCAGAESDLMHALAHIITKIKEGGQNDEKGRK